MGSGMGAVSLTTAHATSAPRFARVAEAPSYRLPIQQHAPDSPATSEFAALGLEVLARGEK